MTEADKRIMRQLSYRWVKGKDAVEWIEEVATKHHIENGDVIWLAIYFAKCMEMDDEEYFAESAIEIRKARPEGCL